MVVNFVDNGDKITVIARIKQNLLAAIFLFIIVSGVFLMLSLLLMILLKANLKVSIMVVLFYLLLIYIFYRILNTKDSNAVNLQKLYRDICDNLNDDILSAK